MPDVVHIQLAQHRLCDLFAQPRRVLLGIFASPDALYAAPAPSTFVIPTASQLPHHPLQRAR
eukprot:801426-Pyramimonas_sp.AAC.1